MSFSRRKFLTVSSLTLLSGWQQTTSASILKSSPERRLKLLNLHTGERLKTCYWAEGSYQLGALAELNYFFRDHRNDQVEGIDAPLLDSLYELTKTLGHRDSIHIISGYRSPETNEKLRKAGRGVAKNSFHLQGRAIDFRLPKQDLTQVRRAALGIHKGGVGYYPKSNFLHLDTGRIRQWG